MIKTWILFSVSAGPGDIGTAVVRASAPDEARRILSEVKARNGITGTSGALAEPYAAIEVDGDDTGVLLAAAGQ
jgi:hypothetical protein